jgi:methyl-accepting chemotaxis protein
MGGFVGVFLILTILSAAIIIFFVTASDTLASYATAGQEQLLKASTDLMNMRRMTGMIHAFNGDEERINGYHNEFNASYEATVNYLDAYMSISESNPQLSPENVAAVVSSVTEMKDTLEQYKTLLFEPNVVNAKKGDVEALGAANVKYGSLIMSVSEGITALTDQEGQMQAEGIAGTRASIHLMVWVFVGVTAVVLVVALLLALYISGMISKPLLLLDDAMHKFGATGDLTLSEKDMESIERYSQIKDEIGQVLCNFTRFVKRVIDVSTELDEVSEGDLTVDIPLLSDRDLMGKALVRMTGSLSDMFDDIRVSTNHVAGGAKQISEGAQALAQGSAEQAASVDQLSGSISEIAEQTRHSAAMAEKAAELANTIKSNAEKGSIQMNEMMQAVKEINAASQSISKVIKVIDDIAFQTNILALNAAVEAARAGQHGKGFAVVAEEVRNLAAKSAEAAKDTGELIANSMTKAELGSRIAGETSASLMEIVSGINESSRLVTEIASESEAQSRGIEQINTGIDRVAHVIQQNSATAQESAASSEQMREQSDILEQLIARFKVKDISTQGGAKSGAKGPQLLGAPGGFRL